MKENRTLASGSRSCLAWLGFYAQNKAHCCFISSFAHGIECCLLLLPCEAKFFVDILFEVAPGMKKLTIIPRATSMVIQLLPAWLAHNYLSEPFKMRASQLVREVGVTGLQRLLSFLPKGDQRFLGWQGFGGQGLAIKVGKHLANALGNMRVQSIQVLNNWPLSLGWQGTLMQSG